MNIRRADLNDSELLSSLCADVRRLHAERHPQVFKMPLGDDFTVAFFVENLALPDMYFFISQEDSILLGYVYCRLIDRPENTFNFAMRYIYIEQMSVRPAARRRGIGRH